MEKNNMKKEITLNGLAELIIETRKDLTKVIEEKNNETRKDLTGLINEKNRLFFRRTRHYNSRPIS